MGMEIVGVVGEDGGYVTAGLTCCPRYLNEYACHVVSRRFQDVLGCISENTYLCSLYGCIDRD